MSKILITGSRNYGRLPLVDAFIHGFLKQNKETAPTKIEDLVVGDARGVDRQAAESWQKYAGKPAIVHKADWQKHGKSAGVIRNNEMLATLTKGDAVFVFWDGESRGTKHCADAARDKGLAVFEVLGFRDIDMQKGHGDLVIKPWPTNET